MDLLNHLFSLPMFTLFVAVAIGLLLGSVQIRGVSLGAAGVFFVALVIGHFQWTIPHEVTELGLVLFVYSVGLHAGPRFFDLLRARGTTFVAIGVCSTAAGAAAAIILAKCFGLSAELAAGLYSGATTCTPALAAALDAINRVLPDHQNIASVGYGVAYPFSIIGVVLLVQALPRLLRRETAAAAAEYRAEEARRFPALEQCAFRITNPNCAARTIDEVQNLRLSQAVICRIKRDGRVSPVRPETVLQLGDVVSAVGAPEELAKLETVLGDVAVESMYDPTGHMASEQVVVSRRQVIGRSLGQLGVWHRYGVVVTRVVRDRVEFSPGGDLVLDPGDVLRVVGALADVDAFAAAVGREERRLDETSLVPFAAGLVVGAAVGQIPIPLPGGLHTQLGLGGGAFLVALVLGHLGHFGPMRLYVPNAAKHFARELGLYIFLAGAGAGAGHNFWPVLRQAGPQLLVAGAIVTIVTALTAVLLLHRLLRWNVLSSAGALSACLTNPAGLAAANRLADCDASAVAFASVYPAALIAKIILAQLIFALLQA